jgi:GNAT superfamily N-acetyltransferase
MTSSVPDLPPGVTLRPGVRTDAPAVVRLWAENDELDEGVLATDLVLDHLFGVANVVVAEAGGTVVGFGATNRAGPITHLTDLFVDRGRQGQGIGRALLAAVFGDARDRTTFASADPRALPAYVRAGMRPWWPSLYLEVGERALAQLGLLPGGAELALLDPAAAGRAGLALGDADRATDYDHWARRPGGILFELRRDGRPAAVGAAATRLRAPGAQLLRLRIASGVDPVAAVLATLGAVGERLGPPAALALPGPHPALRPLLEAGARIVDRDTFMASSPGLVDPERLLPHPAYL